MTCESSKGLKSLSQRVFVPSMAVFQEDRVPVFGLVVWLVISLRSVGWDPEGQRCQLRSPPVKFWRAGRGLCWGSGLFGVVNASCPSFCSLGAIWFIPADAASARMSTGKLPGVLVYPSC